MDELYKKFRPIEMDYTISKKEKTEAMVKWYSDCMDLYYKYNVNKEKMEQSIKNSNMILREGAKELLQLLYKYDIPVVILSAGIGNSIEQFLKEKECLFENTYIISNFIQFDSNGDVKKFDNSKIIHTLNKNMEGKIPVEFENKIKNKKYKFLMGDLIEDLNMLDGLELSNALKVGILNDEMDEYKELYKEKFDIVLQGKNISLKPLIDNIFTN